jgi:microcystin-dependent protein
MSTPFLGQLMLFSQNFAPKGWTFCNGQLLPINQNQALFSLLGTTYGGDGRTTFALPDLRGRTPIMQGAGFVLGEKAGQESHTLIQTEMPAHTHVAQATAAVTNQSAPGAHLLAATTGNVTVYGSAANLTPMNPAMVTNAGGNQPHNNQSPYLVLTWCIALQGIFPSQN